MTAQRVLTMVSAMAMIALTAFSGTASVTAQDATPTSGLGDLGLPELSITVSQAGYEGIPNQLEAGRYLVTVSAAADLEFGGGVAFVQPAGMSADEFLTASSGPPAAGVDDAAGTPVEGAAASPAAVEEGTGGMPEFMYQATYAGGAFAESGESAEAVLDLGPGEWIAWADDSEATQEPIIFEATGEMPAELPEPASSATITMAEYVIEVSEGALVTGPQVVRIDNVGAQPHFIGWFQGPDGMTAEQIEVALDEEMAAEMTGTPVAYSDLNPDEDMTGILFTATQSTGTSMWVPVELEAGTHGLACFFPDVSDGLPHAYHGMYTVIEIAE